MGHFGWHVGEASGKAHFFISVSFLENIIIEQSPFEV